ncbi:MAG: polysaccharide biosynthesis protein [Eubacteriales bacterium]|nr:polysaccharide biosynthesis protein [Eubacteriales bacterium]
MSQQQKSIVGGMTVLSVAGLICKVVAVLYRIPLAWLIGEQGLGTFQLVFPTYNLQLTLASSVLPVAVSRMVSFCLAKDDPRNARRTFRIALALLTAAGALGMFLMLLFNPYLSARVGDPETKAGFIAIAPALLLVCSMSAFRGFMQGQQNMLPTAVSQLIEQVGKVFVALPCAWIGSRIGCTEPGQINIGLAAGGALMGNTIAEAVALLYMTLTCRKGRAAFLARPQNDAEAPMSRKALTRRLLSLAIPITLSACIVPIASFIDSGLLVTRLVDAAGFMRDEARAMYGRYSGYVLSLINVPTALAQAIAMSLVPAVSAAAARGDRKGIARQSATGLRMSFLVGLPSSVGLCLLAKPVLGMIYRFQTEAALDQTAGLLTISSMTIFVFMGVQATSGILQGIRKQRIPMYTLIVGVCVKIFLNYTLIGNPAVNIYGAPIASLTCYLISFLPNLYFVHKHTGLRFDPVNIFLKPLAATAVMGALVWAGKTWLPGGLLSTTLLILLAVASYFGLARLFGALTKDDIAPLTRRFKRKKEQA